MSAGKKTFMKGEYYMQWSNKKPEDGYGDYWLVITEYENNALKKTIGPMIANIRVEGDDVIFDYVATDDGDCLHFSEDMIIERIVPKKPIFGWDNNETANKKLKHAVTRRWEYWIIPIEAPTFHVDNPDTVVPYPVLHQKGLLTIEMDKFKAAPLLGDVGVQIGRDGRVWVCYDGHSLIRFKPLNETQFKIYKGV